MKTYSKHLDTISSCPFCDPTDSDIIHTYSHRVLVDAYFPYCDGHMLLCPIRHISSYIQLSSQELIELNKIQPQLLQKYYTHDYQEVSVLIRDGVQSTTKTKKSTTGKTLNHLHIHFIPDLPIWAEHLIWKKWFTRTPVTQQQQNINRNIASSKRFPCIYT